MFTFAYVVSVAYALLYNVYTFYIKSVYLHVYLMCVCVVCVVWVMCRVYVSVWGWICVCVEFA